MEKHFNTKKNTFREFHQNEIAKIIKELPKNKASIFKDILVKIMINSVHIYPQAFAKIIYYCVKSRNFLDILKYAD